MTTASAFGTAADAAAALEHRALQHLIDGQLAGSAQSFEVVNPATGRAFIACPQADQSQLERAVAAAQRAQPAWAQSSPEERRARVRALAAKLREHHAELAACITLEQGKPLSRAIMEVMRAAEQAERIAMLDIGVEVLRDDTQGRVEMHYRPLGVVGAIAPWNMPVVLAVPKIVHALYCGNAIVLKPSPYTPVATLRLGQLLCDVFPPGVLNILAGGDDFGRWMSEHPGIAKISFTGSIPTGRRVMASAAASLKRLTLELGGNDAAIVLADADPAEVAPKLFASAFANAGQVCMAVKRLYVHESLHDELADRLAQLARNVRVGDGFEPGVEMGPVQNKAQYQVIERILGDSRRRGANFLAGGNILDRPGYFIEPTIVTDVAEGAAVVDEEPFGPVLPILRFADVEDAVQRANAGKFGLGASVWSKDVGQAAAIASRLEAGTAWVNQHSVVDAHVPFGGAKQSGLGRQFGLDGLHDYMEAMAVFIPKTEGV